MQPLIVPAILVKTFEELRQQLAKVNGLFPSVQLDIMDGVFVENTSFPQRDELLDLKTTITFELHLMVQRPLLEMEAWKRIPPVQNVVFHIESADDPVACIDAAKDRGWKIGIAVNPETPVEKIQPYLSLIDEVLFMTVHPGHQGSPFVPAVKEKLKVYQQLTQRPLCAVDGAINKNNIAELVNLGVQKFYVGEALLKAENIQQAYEELQKALKH